MSGRSDASPSAAKECTVKNAKDRAYTGYIWHLRRKSIYRVYMAPEAYGRYLVESAGCCHLSSVCVEFTSNVNPTAEHGHKYDVRYFRIDNYMCSTLMTPILRLHLVLNMLPDVGDPAALAGVLLTWRRVRDRTTGEIGSHRPSELGQYAAERTGRETQRRTGTTASPAVQYHRC